MNNAKRKTRSMSPEKMIKFVNCHVLDYQYNKNKESFYEGEVVVDQEEGVIVDVIRSIEGSTSKDWKDIKTFDCDGRILSPGYIDIQLNGAFGVDFSIAETIDHSSIKTVTRKLLSHGVTSFCPTLISCTPATYHKILSLFAQYMQMQHRADKCSKNKTARILGIHLEGPFFEPSKRGAHPLQCIIDPVNGIRTVEEIYGREFLYDSKIFTSSLSGLIRIITLAPERPGALLAIRQLAQGIECTNGDEISTINSNKKMKTSRNEIVVSCGHTNASLKQGQEAMRNGASLITHMFNAMKPFHHRDPGLLGLLTEEVETPNKNHSNNHYDVGPESKLQRPFYSIIADGIHVHPTAVKMAYSLHPTGAILVTDAMSAMGLGDGIHTLGQHMKVQIKGKKATILNTNTLAGSAVSMDYCVRSFQKFTNCSVGEALLAATLRPSQLLRWEHGGKVKKGCVADLILLDERLNVTDCWISGIKVPQTQETITTPNLKNNVC